MALTDNLVSYWELEDATDSHGSNDLTNNGVSFVAGKIGNGGDFEASQNDYLSKADNADLSLNGTNFTISAWVKIESKPVSSSAGIVTKYNFTTENREYRLGLSTSDRFFISVSSIGGSGGETILFANNFGSPSLDTWYHIIARYDGSTLKIRVNNGTDDSTSYSSGVFNGTSDFYIGRYINGSDFDGLIDEVGLWKRSLTDEECGQLNNGGNALAYPLTPEANFSISPTTIRNLTSGIVLTLTGDGTSWDGTTVFSISGVTGATKVSQNVTSATSATVTIDTGSGAGTLTVTESVTGDATATTVVSNAFTSKADGDWNSGGQTTWNEEGVPTEHNTVTISSGHDITVTSDTKCGTGSGTALTLSGTLTVTGAKFTLRGNATMNSNSILTVQNNGATQATFEFDADTGVSPTVAMASNTKTIFTGTSYANPCIINTKSGSAGNQGRFTAVASSAVGFDWQYAAFYRLGGTTADEAGRAYTSNPTATFINRMRNCYVDMATCGSLPYIFVFSGGADFIQILDNVWGYQGTSGYSQKSWGIEITNDLCDLTTGTREVIGNVVWGTPILTGRVNIPFISGVTFRHNAFLSGWFGSLSDYFAAFEENFGVVGGGIGTSVSGPSLNNFIVADHAAGQDTILYFINSPDETTCLFDGNVFQDVSRTSGFALCIACTGGGTTTRNLEVKRNLVLPSQGTAHLRLADCLYRGEFTAITKLTAEHNTVVSNGTMNAFHVFGYDSTTPKLQATDMAISIKSNIVIGTSGYVITNYNNSAPAITDSMRATAASHNCHDGLSSVAAGAWSATSGDTGIQAGTPYNVPMSGAVAPGASDLQDTDPEFVDPTRDLTTWAVTQGSDGATFDERVDDAYAIIAADPRTKIPALVAWVKAGFKVRNLLLKDAGHDDVTIGALEYQAAGGGRGMGSKYGHTLLRP